MDEDRKALLAAVAAAAAAPSAGGESSEEQYESLLVYVKRHTSRNDDLDLGEIFQTMPKKESTRVWNRLLEVVTPIVEEGRFLSQDEEEEDDGEDQEGRETPASISAGESGQGGATPERPSTPEGPGAGAVPGRPRRRGAAAAAAVEDDGGGGGGPDSGEKSHAKNKKKKKGSQASASLATEVLHATAILAYEFLSDKDRVAPRALVDTAVCLHDILLSLQGLQGEALQGIIAKVCEIWWTQDRPGAEHLVVHLLPVMLVRSLDLDAKEADVKRMHGLRKALLLLDFEDESSDSLRALLLRTFIAPVYLKCSEGKRLLASLFGLHPSLVAEIHAVMKAQMPGAKKAVLAAYGEIYFRVWRGAEGPYLGKVEMLCLQDLMHACIHASTPKMHQNILVVLGGLHSQKKVKGVDADLLRLYAPVMWRSLRVANPSVRAQACQVLVDAFPLQDPSAGAAAFDTTLRQQFDALTNLLDDTQPKVRAVAAKGACRVLSVFWEMIPTDTTRALLTRVIGRLASDASSPLVRLAAVEGLTLLLECPHSHSVLKSMLPGVQNLIHDTNKKVRTAFVKLLLVVKGVKAIKYYQVVTVDHILARLSEDHLRCPASASALSKLILNSYFPTGPGVTGSFQVSRCLTLLSQDPGAAEAFFCRLHQNAGVPSAAKVIAMLVRCVVVAAARSPVAEGEEGDGDGGGGEKGVAKKKGPRKGKRKGLPKHEEEEQEEAAKGRREGGLQIKASDSKSMAGILNLIASIWESILPALEKSVNGPSLELIQQTVTGEALSVLHRRFCGQVDSRAAFMRVAGLAGGDLAPGMLEDVVVEMLALPADAPQSAYGPTVDLLCSWGQHEHLVGAIVESLRKAFSPSDATAGEAETGTTDYGLDSATDSGARGKRRRPVSRRRSDGEGQGKENQGRGLPSPLALNMLGHLLAGGNGHPSTEAARDAITANDAAVDSLEAVLLLARSATTTRLSSASSTIFTAPHAISPAPAIAVKSEAEGDEAWRRRCPDDLLVRAVEALGRVYMHREAAMAGDGKHLAGVGGGGEGELQQQLEEDGEEMASMLQPMPFSVKMRELMVWATGTVLPVLVGGVGSLGGGDVVEDVGGTPVKAAGASLVMGSPSPMPPPRSRARASSSSNDSDDASANAAATAAVAAAARASALAGGIFGVVVLLASEWVEVGSGLAEISMRADTWGNRLLASLHQEENGDHEGRTTSGINAVLPQLCRLSLHLSARESQGARPPASIWEVLLKCADRRISTSQEGGVAEKTGEGDEGGSTCVQKYVSALVALEGRKGGLSSLVQSLLEFMYSQAFTSDEEDEAEHEEQTSGKGPSIDTLTRLEVRAMQDEDSDEPPESMLLQLSRPAAAVLWSVVRSAPASKLAGELILSHLAAFGSGDAAGTGADWPLFCAHALGALIEHAPAKARMELAADAHAELKAVTSAAAADAGPTCLLSSSYVSARSSSNTSSVVMSPAVAAAGVAPEAASPGASSGDAPGVREEEGVSTRKAAAFAVGAIYGRLEAARRAAVAATGGAGRGAGSMSGIGAEDASAAVAVSA